MVAGVAEAEGFVEQLAVLFVAGCLAFFQKLCGFACQPAAKQIAGLVPFARLILLAVRKARCPVPSVLVPRSSSHFLPNPSGGCNSVLVSLSESLFSLQGRQVTHGLC